MICSRQEKCPADVTLLLNRWEIPVEQHPAIINQLIREKFIDEQRYASAYIKDKIKFDHWGFIKIRAMLNQKGISKKITDDNIREIDRAEYRKMIGSELDKKRRTVKGTPYEIWAKLARYGSSRGYAMEDMEEFLGGY
jgi:regulatory protein